MDALLQMLFDVVHPLLDFCNAEMFQPLVNDSRYRTGFFWGVAMSFILGFSFRQLAYRWEKVRDFFKPGKEPASKDAPSPAAKAVSTSTSFVSAFGCLIVVVILVIILVAILSMASVHN